MFLAFISEIYASIVSVCVALRDEKKRFEIRQTIVAWVAIEM